MSTSALERPVHRAPARLAVGALAAASLACAAMGQVAESPENTATLQMPFESLADMVIVPVEVNGSRPLQCILDTGMPEGVFIFDPELGEELGLEYAMTVPVRGGGTERRMAHLAMGVAFSLGELDFDQQRAIVLEKRGKLSNLGVDGVIGATIFNRYVVEMDFESSTLSLFDPATFDAADAGTSIPLVISSTRPHVDAEVSIDGETTVPLRIVVDTGAGHALSLNLAASEQLALPEPVLTTVVGTGVGGDIAGKVGRIARLRLGPIEVENIVGRFPDDPQIGGAGLLGMHVLRQFTPTFDYTNGRLLLKPSASRGRPFEFNMAGLILRPRGGDQLEVNGVVEASPAAEAGVRSGDLIVAIDGRAPDVFGERTQRLFQKEGRSLVLTLDRDGERIQVSIELRRLI